MEETRRMMQTGWQTEADAMKPRSTAEVGASRNHSGRDVVFLTCSIRRKLFVQFALVFLMLLVMFSAAVVGLIAYRDVVNDLEYSIQDAPRKADLLAAIDILFEPLLLQPPEHDNYDPETFAAFQHHHFGRALRQSQATIREFLQRLETL